MSAKGLEWARKLRSELECRISELREALAGIEPLRVELARLEEQKNGVERLIAAYENQLGFAKPEHTAPLPAPVVRSAQDTPPPLIDALLPVEIPESPTVIAILRAEAFAILAACRKGAALTRNAATRLWLSARVWFSRHFPDHNAQS
jgi:hypothetical protein